MAHTVITKKGLEKIAKATVDNPLILETFAIGDGGGSAIIPNEDMISLVNEKYKTFINNKYNNNNKIIAECVIPIDAEITEGIYIREIGLFDIEGDLIAIADTPLQYRPASQASGIVTELQFSIALQVSNTEDIVIEIQESMFATVDALNREIETRTEEDTKIQEKLQNNINKNDVSKWEEVVQVIPMVSTDFDYFIQLHPYKINTIIFYQESNQPTFNRVRLAFSCNEAPVALKLLLDIATMNQNEIYADRPSPQIILDLQPNGVTKYRDTLLCPPTNWFSNNPGVWTPNEIKAVNGMLEGGVSATEVNQQYGTNIDSIKNFVIYKKIFWQLGF